MIGPSTVEGERGSPTPGIRRPRRTRVAAFMTLALFAVGSTVGALWWRLGSAGDDTKSGYERAPSDLASAVPPISFPDPFEHDEEPEEPEPEQQTVASIDLMPLPETYVPAPIPVVASAEPVESPKTVVAGPRVLDKSASPIQLAQNNAAVTTAEAENPVPADDGGSLGMFEASGEEAGQGGTDSLGERLTPTKLEATLAARLADRSLTITAGTMIDCALSTRLISALPGMTNCIVTRNVYSDDGRVLLLERGTEIIGEYRSNVQHGTNRVFVLWTRAKTPTGVVVDLGSPATDGLGATGIPGDVDNHFWTRFGGAILLSLVDDVASAASASAAQTSDGTQVNVGGSINSGSRVIEEVLRQTINIPPTVSVGQGARVGVYVARDLDFRSVYSVRASR